MDTDIEYCDFCGKEIACASAVSIEGADYICTGKQELTMDPFAVEIHEDRTEVMLCPGSRQIHADDI